MELSPGERVDMRRRIADHLCQQPWPDIDLILEEFECRTSDQWSGDNRTYVLEMTRECPDARLTQLDTYLRPGTQIEEQPAVARIIGSEQSPWSGTGFRLFLSHVHPYAGVAGELRAAMALRSVDTFVAHDSIEATAEWKSVILEALNSCDGCLALLTPGFGSSVWCDQEVGFCLARGKLVVPVDYGQVPYGFLGDLQSFRVNQNMSADDIALAVFNILVRHPSTRLEMAAALVQRWEDTASFNAARENYSLLCAVAPEAWSAALIDRVRAARNRNEELLYANINWTDSETAVNKLFSEVRPAS